MKERVLEFLKKSLNAVTTEELCSLMGDLSVKDIEEVQKILNELVQNGEIYFTNKGKYILFENCQDIKIGKIDVHPKGFGFLLLPGDDIHIEKNMLNGAIDGDTVIVEITERKPKLEGRVLRIFKRNLNNLVGEIRFIHGKPFMNLEDKRKLIIELDPKSTRDCVEGTIVQASIIKEIRKNYYLARVSSVIGHKDDAGVDILTIAYKYEIYPDFSKSTLKEIEDIPTEVDPKELVGRKDLTEEIIFTIDGADTKDIDDAISLSRKGSNYLLGVHIADVSHYVKEGSALNEDAMNRGTSSYLADTVIPMIPHKLSNGICSLNEGVIRLTESCVMEIDHNGSIVDFDIFESYIKSKKKMTYKEVNEVIMHDKVPKGYEEFKDILKSMNDLAHLLRKKKEREGYIDFNLDEAKIICDENGRACEIQRRVQEDGERMIEQFMVAANETVATCISNMELPFIYRVHDIPSEEKIQDFLKFVSILGYQLNAKIKNITPKAMQEILDQLRDKKEVEALSTTLLRSMKKAKYQKENIGHFGLASKYYTHFTSPIRRYPDLLVHRLLRKYLFDHEIDDKINELEPKIDYIAELSSERELKAVEAEREVDDMKMAEYMEGHIGEEFDGKISGLTNFGIFVELDNMVEGLVHISAIGDDFFHYNSDIMAIVGDNTKKLYRLGDKLKVKVIRANKQEKQIDFEIVGGEEDGDKKQES
ncbi:MAG: ribonuclease R [Bacilli bacterium]|nr:ribonuclease R [Bacilli bacterium]